MDFVALHELQVAYRVISRQRAISVAFRAKRTLSRIYEYTA